MVQRLFFVYGAYILFAASLLGKQVRECKNTYYLGLAILLSIFITLFHSATLKAESVAINYVVFARLSEGMMYIITACLLYFCIVRSTSTFNITYPLLIVNGINLIVALSQVLGLNFIWSHVPTISGMMGTKSQLAVFSAISIPIIAKEYGNGRLSYIAWMIPLCCLFLAHSFTGIFALALALFIYCLKTKQYERAGLIVLITILVFGMFYREIIPKWKVRLEMIQYSLSEIMRSPLVGYGFDNSINMNRVYSKVDACLTYRHNDFLNICKDMGIPFLALILLFIKDTLVNKKKDFYWIACLVAIFSCMFQTSMYFARIAGIVIVILALKVCEENKDVAGVC